MISYQLSTITNLSDELTTKEPSINHGLRSFINLKHQRTPRLVVLDHISLPSRRLSCPHHFLQAATDVRDGADGCDARPGSGSPLTGAVSSRGNQG